MSNGTFSQLTEKKRAIASETRKKGIPGPTSNRKNANFRLTRGLKAMSRIGKRSIVVYVLAYGLELITWPDGVLDVHYRRSVTMPAHAMAYIGEGI